mgnify:CR=1 FL=1
MIRRLRALGCLLGATLAAQGEGAEPRPNFVVIMAEAQAWAGSSVQMDDQVPASRSTVFKTPALERLAREGMRFAYGYAASPRCTPSRAALFTGRSPAALCMTYVGVGRESADVMAGRKLLPPEPLLEMPERVVTVGKVLQAAGYATAHFGKWHVGRTSPARHGFQESDGPTNNGGPDNVASPNPKEAFGMTERGIAFAAKSQRAGRPFYLQLSHYPNQPEKSGVHPPKTFDDETAIVDQTLGQLLDAVGVKSAALVGHSWGSLIALGTASNLKARISHLVLVGTAFPMKVTPALLEASLNAAIDEAAAAQVPNVITFSGNRRGMDDQLGADNCVAFLNKVKAHAEQMKQQGYDPHMVFVNTSLDVAKHRNRQRARSLPDHEVEKMHGKPEEKPIAFLMLRTMQRARLPHQILQRKLCRHLLAVKLPWFRRCQL